MEFMGENSHSREYQLNFTTAREITSPYHGIYSVSREVFVFFFCAQHVVRFLLVVNKTPSILSLSLSLSLLSKRKKKKTD